MGYISAVTYYLLLLNGHVLQKERDDWVKKCTEYEVQA